MTDNDILNYFIKSNGHIIISKLKNIPVDIEIYLRNKYDYYDNYKEVIKRIQYNITNRPVCPICGNPVKFIGKIKRMFTDTCGDKKCIIELSNKNIKITKKERYGNENYSNIEKSKQTKLKKYGNAYYTNREKAKQTTLERYGEEYALKLDIFKEKSKQTCLKKYGVEYTGQIKEKIEKTKKINSNKSDFEKNKIKEKIKQTCLEKYGVEFVFQSDIIKEKSKQTCLERYGVINGGGTKQSIEKIKQTCLERYGVDNYSKTNEFKQYFSYLFSTEEIQNKINNTKKKNKSYNKSQSEDDLYIILKEKYPDIVRQYRDKRYPFNCDFYIPSKDLFIEYQGSQYHQGHPFNIQDENDIKILKELKEKANKSNRHKEGKKSQYDMIIYTWTDLDVRKRTLAKENKLNYIELWDLININDILNKY